MLEHARWILVLLARVIVGVVYDWLRAIVLNLCLVRDILHAHKELCRFEYMVSSRPFSAVAYAPFQKLQIIVVFILSNMSPP